MAVSWGQDARALTHAVTSLTGTGFGAYPAGNSLLIRGSAQTVIVDPSVTVAEKGGVPFDVDTVINSHGHEDHMAGNGAFPEAQVFVHQLDLDMAHRLEALLHAFGYNSVEHPEMATYFAEKFHYTSRPDAVGFDDGHVWDLGGVTVEAVHLPGHTAGHCGLRISGGVFFLGDIDLTGFGPYYGDVWSDLEQFEQSLAVVREEDARFYATFHHKGVIESRGTFLEMIDDFAAVIPRRHRTMLDFLAEPRTIEEMVEHRFIYRPKDDVVFIDNVERRSAVLHVERMRTRGEIEDIDEERFRAI